jgi:hypothetical protein
LHEVTAPSFAHAPHEERDAIKGREQLVHAQRMEYNDLQDLAVTPNLKPRKSRMNEAIELYSLQLIITDCTDMSSNNSSWQKLPTMLRTSSMTMVLISPLQNALAKKAINKQNSHVLAKMAMS